MYQKVPKKEKRMRNIYYLILREIITCFARNNVNYLPSEQKLAFLARSK